ncbi:MAG: 1-phosphofructokinase family hexose kinase [Candidatus Acidiferrales bacterium]
MIVRKIVCLSANPALDRRMRVHLLARGEVNRAQGSLAMPGGKAAHVAMAARALGAHSIWIGFLGGAIGEEVAAGLRKLEIEVWPVRSESSTRVNLELVEDNGRITEVLEPGGPPGRAGEAEMLRLCAQGLRGPWEGALLSISGSLPPQAPANFYASLVGAARAAGSKVFLDTSGDALRAGLEAGPDFVKPNRKESEALLGRPVRDAREALEAAQELIRCGARSAAVTLGADGLVWFESEGGPGWSARPPRLKPVSTVGCGDATLAGFAWATLQGLAGEKALRLAVACGAANCLAEIEGRILADDVQSIIPQVEVLRL